MKIIIEKDENISNIYYDSEEIQKKFKKIIKKNQIKSKEIREIMIYIDNEITKAKEVITNAD